jgi:hypothetical protein
MLGRLDAFPDDVEAEGLAEPDDGLHDRRGLPARSQAATKLSSILRNRTGKRVK